ncbi:hypothetical protein TDIS_2006 [Thermosulfurimonas dismutans]|uniref:Clostripain n=2 Tax=Thermosulfurimonas dismutans TaxID=999894 RepID=A0A179D1E1_9BACT|nr:hypothetical protein TDIS_2006 [Thermosulfurimonas dismutans]
MQIYLVPFYASLNGTEFPSDSVLLSEVTTSQGNYTLEITPDDTAYQQLKEALGGAYYLVLRASPSGVGEGDLATSLDNDTFTGTSPYLKLKSRWTVMVYMGGDNSLGTYVDSDLSEMASVGSSPEVNVVAQADTYYGPAKRYFVESGEAVELEDLGEVDMSRVDTLVNFARWVFEHFPADHYLLVLWNHGGGFKARGYSVTRNLLWDDNPDYDSSMSLPRLADALSQIRDFLGRPIDLVGMDACLMAMAEVAYEIRGLASYMVGSENFEWVVGWPYDHILQALSENATMGSSELARVIVGRFINYYLNYSSSSLATQSAIDLSLMDIIANATDVLARELLSVFSSNATLFDHFRNQILAQVQYFDDNNDTFIDRTIDNYVDLYHLAQLLANDPGFPSSVRDAASQLMSILDSAIIANANTGDGVKDAHGLSIWLPHAPDYTSYISLYRALAWSNATAWDDLLDTISPNL